MTLDKAIELQENLIRDKSSNLIQDESDAIKLGIEALKAIKKVRPSGYWDIDDPLPGEDPENSPTRSLHHIREVLAGNEVSK